MVDYISAAQAARKWCVSVQRVQLLCKLGRIEGVQRISHAYLIPKDAEKPKDARKKHE
jgi:hypothetical protein